MNDARKLLISFEPAFGNIDMVRAAVRGVCSDYFQLVYNAASIMDFCLIVTELMNNAVKHAISPVIVVELVLSDHEATFCLISKGTGFDPTLPAEMPGLEPDKEFPEGGYGLALIQALADDMEYERLDNRNMVTLRKTFPVRAWKER